MSTKRAKSLGPCWVKKWKEYHITKDIIIKRRILKRKHGSIGLILQRRAVYCNMKGIIPAKFKYSNSSIWFLVYSPANLRYWVYDGRQKKSRIFNTIKISKKNIFISYQIVATKLLVIKLSLLCGYQIVSH